jgi:SAM-dependent methyltransferase
MSADELTDEELLSLDHNDHSGAFIGYLNQSRHTRDKQLFLRSWVKPTASDEILECGSSSGKTSIDFVRHSGCYCLGVDFDLKAVEISIANRDKYFPELLGRCDFECGDLTNIKFERKFNKVIMPDFSEHIPDRVFASILKNISDQLGETNLYVYTPNRSHIFEIMKHRNFILKNSSGHINVKTRRQVAEFLTANGWVVMENSWRCSSMSYIKYFEIILGNLPFVGKYFQRRVVIIAKPAKSY